MPQIIRAMTVAASAALTLTVLVAPAVVALPANATAQTFAAGGVNNCAITGSAAVRCWGYSDDGQTATPAGVAPASAVTVGDAHICALNTAGTVKCWGANDAGQTAVPADLTGVSAIDAGGRHTCGVITSGAVRCWGSNDQGQTSVPQGLTGVDVVSAGGATSCAVASGAVTCWGDNSEGQATPPAFPATVTAVSVGGLHACALLQTQAVVCWGNNEDGQATVPAGLSATAISAGDSHTCALSTATAVVCWGNNMYGQTNVPAGLSGMRVVSAGAAHSCAVGADGAVRCWGNNDDGEGQAGVADAPTALTVAAANGSVTATWQAPDFDGGAPITRFEATASTGQGCTTVASVATCTISGLKNGTAVTVSVVAVNATGTSAAAVSAAVTPSVPLVPPPAPTGVVALPADRAASVVWTAPKPGAGVTINGYTVTAQPGGLTCTSKASPCAFTGLSRGTTYSFTVAAQSNAGAGASSTPVYAAANPFSVTASASSVKANASVVFTVTGAPDAATVTLSGAAKGSAVANRDGVATITAAVAKSAAVAATATVAKVAYKASANIYVPVVKLPASGTVGKPLAFAVSAARPGSTATLTFADGSVTLSQPVASNGSATLAFTPSVKGSFSARVTVDGVDCGSTTVTVK